MQMKTKYTFLLKRLNEIFLKIITCSYGKDIAAKHIGDGSVNGYFLKGN